MRTCSASASPSRSCGPARWSLHERIDTTTSGGRLIFDMFGALAEFERDLIRERTMAGLAAARARGRKGGRPALLAVLAAAEEPPGRRAGHRAELADEVRVIEVAGGDGEARPARF